MLDFLGLGAQKAGTTWLYDGLRQHPAIDFPLGKEAHFWNGEAPESGLAAYDAAFARGAGASGEITPAYALLPDERIRLLHRHYPEVRLIYLLRNPMLRAWSSARMALLRAEMLPQEASEAWFADHFHSAGSLGRGDYAGTLRRWRRHFDPRQLAIYRFEQIAADGGALLAAVCAHIGVSAPTQDMLAGCANRVFPGPDTALTPRLAGVLLDLYEARIRDLEDLLGCDFGEWIDEVAAVRDGNAPSRDKPARRDLVRAPLVTVAASAAAEEAFDPDWYLCAYPDVAAAGLDPLQHYEKHGRAEGRLPRAPSEDAPPSVATKAEDPAAGYDSFLRAALFEQQRAAPFGAETLRALAHMRLLERALQERLEASAYGGPDGAADGAADGADGSDLGVSVAMIPEAAGPLSRRAVASVLNASQGVTELLLGVRDGVASDAAAAAELSSLDAKIRVVALPGQASTGRLWNALLAAARAPYVCLLPSHAAFTPGALGLLRAVLQQSPGCPLAYAAALETRAEAPLDFAAAWSERVAAARALRFAPFSRAHLEHGPRIGIGGALLRREVWRACQGFDETLQGGVGWDFLLRATRERAAISLPCVLLQYSGAPLADEAPAAEDSRRIQAKLAAERLDAVVGGVAGAAEQTMHAVQGRRHARTRRPVGVVIPSFECAEYLALCLRAIRCFSPPDTHVIVVDNASGPAVQRLLAELEGSAHCQVLRNERNLGFSFAVNQGLERLPEGHDCVILNNDAVVTPGWLGALQHAVEAVPDTGLVAPRQVLLPGSPTMQSHCPGAVASRELDVTLSAHHRNLLGPLDDADCSGLMELDFAPFFCVYLPRETLQAVGPLDHELGPHYESDRFYCEAVRRMAGKRIVYTPYAKVYHFLQQATDALRKTDPQVYDALFVHNAWSRVSRPGVGPE